MFERFTDDARRVMVQVQDEARSLGHGYIGTEHLLLGLLRYPGAKGVVVLQALGIEPDTVRAAVQAAVPAGEIPVTRGHLPFTPRAKSVVELSVREATELGHESVGSEHVLLALLRERDGVAHQVLAAQGAELAPARRLVSDLYADLERGEAEPDPASPGAYDDVDAALAVVASEEADRREVEDVERYLAEIRRYPVLTAADEIELAQKIELGRDAAQRLETAAELSADERAALARLEAEADHAERALTESNLRLVVTIARNYEGRGLSRVDLIQEGNLGLIAAVDRFEWRKGFTFSVFATWWIRQAITRALPRPR